MKSLIMSLKYARERASWGINMVSFKLARQILVALTAFAVTCAVGGTAFADTAQDNQQLKEQMRIMMQQMQELQKQVQQLKQQQQAQPTAAAPPAPAQPPAPTMGPAPAAPMAAKQAPAEPA